MVRNNSVIPNEREGPLARCEIRQVHVKLQAIARSFPSYLMDFSVKVVRVLLQVAGSG